MSSPYDLSGRGWPALIRADQADLLERGARLARANAAMYDSGSEYSISQREHAESLEKKSAELRAQNRED